MHSKVAESVTDTIHRGNGNLVKNLMAEFGAAEKLHRELFVAYMLGRQGDTTEAATLGSQICSAIEEALWEQ